MQNLVSVPYNVLCFLKRLIILKVMVFKMSTCSNYKIGLFIKNIAFLTAYFVPVVLSARNVIINKTNTTFVKPTL